MLSIAPHANHVTLATISKLKSLIAKINKNVSILNVTFDVNV
jgi:hypothetical protein